MKLSLKQRLIILAINLLGWGCILFGLIWTIVNKFFLNQNYKVSIGFSSIIVIFVGVKVFKWVITKKSAQRAQATETAGALGKSVKSFNVPITKLVEGLTTVYPILIALLLLVINEAYVGDLKDAVIVMSVLLVVGYVIFAVAEGVKQSMLLKLEIKEEERLREAQTESIRQAIKKEMEVR